METTIVESNVLIAEFMGRNTHHTGGILLYHDDWNWLMPVVEKIEGLTVKVNEPGDELHDTREVEYQFTVCIENEQCMIHVDFLPQYYGTDTDFFKTYDCRNREKGVSKLQAAYQAVIEFINWHNSNQPPTINQ